MTHDFAIKWAYCWLAAFGGFSFIGIAIKLPLPSIPWAVLLGAAFAALITGPIVWVAFTRT